MMGEPSQLLILSAVTVKYMPGERKTHQSRLAVSIGAELTKQYLGSGTGVLSLKMTAKHMIFKLK